MRILVIGLPRSGTTWFARALAAAPGVHLVEEPDNRRVDPFAYVGTRGLGDVPAVTPGRRVPRYELLWDLAFSGGWPAGGTAASLKRIGSHPAVPKALRIAAMIAAANAARRRKPPGEHQMVKSVFAWLSVEWLSERYRPMVVILWRNPLNKLAGYLDREWPLDERAGVLDRLRGSSAWPPPLSGATERATWSICAEMNALFAATTRHPEWLVLQHDVLCIDPLTSYRRVFDRIGLRWSDAVEDFLDETNRPGELLYEPFRLTKDQPTAWKRRLTSEQVEAAIDVMRRFTELPGIGPAVESCLIGARD